MFDTRKKNRDQKIDTLVGKDTEVSGNIVFRGGLLVEGVVHGSVSAAHDDPAATLTVGAGALIEGEVNVPRILLDGAVNGDVHSGDMVELAPNARVSGNIYYERIEMAMGAEVNGQLVHVQPAEIAETANN